jgi:hypothetical protein
MFRFSITDRRLSPGGKSLNNRRRFVERIKTSVKQAAHKQIKNRTLQDGSGQEVSVSKDGIDEPQFHYSISNGEWDHVLPGNHDYTVGDKIKRPEGGGGGRGSEGSPDGDGEDDFRFDLTFEEYMDALLDDLCLPDMIKASDKQTVSYSMRRAGYTTVGSTSNLALEKTMIQGIGRRLALKAPKIAEIARLTEEVENESDPERIAAIEEEIAVLRRRADAINFLEKTDLRYNNFIKQPNPITRAVVFMLMDVSGSMTEEMKELAKRFYLLLYLFLNRQYKHVDIVFIRHTHQAREVDQDTFFNSPETGGTVVSSAYQEMKRIINERYDVAQWNIYMAQASDGDNTLTDQDLATSLLRELLPQVQYATYVQVGADTTGTYYHRETEVWKMFEEIIKLHSNVAARKLHKADDVVPVFRSLFAKKSVAA